MVLRMSFKCIVNENKKETTKKYETERGKLKIKKFLTQRRKNHVQTKVSRRYCNPLL